jgi:hypothetical protein
LPRPYSIETRGCSSADVGATVIATTPAGDIMLAVAYSGTFRMTAGDMVTAVGACNVGYGEGSD